MSSWAIATEDVLSEEVAFRLIRERSPAPDGVLPLRKDGFGYLKASIGKFYQLSNRMSVLLLTDLDRRPCAAGLVTDWLGRRQAPEGLIFRVVVRAIESWLLADHQAIGSLLEASSARLPVDPDALDDPKRALLDLARRAPRAVRDDLLPARGALAKVGTGYNSRLTEFIRNDWSPERAAERSESLHRARLRIAGLRI